MGLIQSRLKPQSEAFRSAAQAMRAMVADLNARLAAQADGGGEAVRARHCARGKLPVRERIAALLDADAPWLAPQKAGAAQAVDVGGLITLPAFPALASPAGRAHWRTGMPCDAISALASPTVCSP